ncbi:MAG: ribulose-phosphate 3-epimerase [Oscillospiraceae bacterium]|nr:ribulose-phosphate 3-epimerase [Oscillospiraceae bacterium]
MISINKTIVSASLLACDFSSLAYESERCAKAGVDWIHFDVMDGHFVEQITYGSAVLKSIDKVTDKFMDVHLMVDNPERQIPLFARAGADLIDVHVESSRDIFGCLEEIRAFGIKSAVAVKPNTPVEEAFKYLPLCDMVLVMTVEPGYGGQSFMTNMLPKITKLREYADKNGFSDLDIQVDGGVNVRTAKLARKAGANVLVAGTGLFGAADMNAVCAALKGI